MEKKHRIKLVTLGIVKVVGFIVLTQLLQRLVFIPLAAFSSKYWSQYDGRGLNEPWFLTTAIASILVILFACFIFMRFIDKKNWAYIRLIPNNRFKYFSIGVLVSFLPIGIFALTNIIFKTVELNLDIKSISSIAVYFLILPIGLFAFVLYEELIFRGYTLKTLETHGGMMYAVIVSSLLFSAFHFLNPNVSILGFTNIFLLGAFVAIVCIYYNNIWASVGLHFGWNLILWFFNFPISGHQYPNPIFTLRNNSYSLISGSKFGPEDSLLITFIVSLSILYYIFKFKKMERQNALARLQQ